LVGKDNRSRVEMTLTNDDGYNEMHMLAEMSEKMFCAQTTNCIARVVAAAMDAHTSKR